MKRLLVVLFAVLFTVPAVTGPAQAGDLADARATVANAVSTVEDLRQDRNFQTDMEGFLQRARAVLVVPNFYKGGFVVGGAYGNGVLLVRNDAGEFSPPAFYRLAGGSLGLQIGGQRARMMFMIMTEKGLNAIMNDQFKIGASGGVSFATFGGNIEAGTTTNMDTDIIAFARADGLYGGGVIEGAAINPRPMWNAAVYGKGATPRQILFDRKWTWPDAEPLIAALERPRESGGAAPAVPQSAAPEGMGMTPAQEPVPQPMPQGTGGTASGPGQSAPAPVPANDKGPIQLMPVERQSLE